MVKESGKKFRVINYLVEVPTVQELSSLIAKLGISAEDLVRKKEPLFMEKFSGRKYSDEQWLKILHEHPILIQRPILVKRTRAIIGRPPEVVLKWI
jgi:arsenate reductase